MTNLLLALIYLIFISLGLPDAIPTHFGVDRSQAIIGVQMAFAYLGTLAMPALFGLIAGAISAALFPVYLLAILVLMTVLHERLIRVIGYERKA